VQEGSGEKSEEATHQRRDDYRKRGQVAHTKELGSVFMFLGSALAFWTLSRFYNQQSRLVFEYALGDSLVESVRAGNIFDPIKYAGTRAVMMILPCLAIMGILGFASSALQIGFISKEDALEFKFEQLNPIAGFKRLFSLRSVVEAIKALLKLAMVGFVTWTVLRNEFIHSPLLIEMDASALLSYMLTTTVRLILWVGGLMLVLAAMDYFYNWWDLEKQMRMSKQEVKEETKNREGDPLIKARIRRIQRELAQKRMMDAVPKADVIITNPTHIAVALKYDAQSTAPQLIAKGADFVAERIKERARQLGIPIVENKPLARTIFKTLKIGQVIPRELYNSVAEVLAYVYKIKRKAFN
jgi:flagellar biosynthetic protein FlhB